MALENQNAAFVEDFTTMNDQFQWPWQGGPRLLSLADMKKYFAKDFAILADRMNVLRLLEMQLIYESKGDAELVGMMTEQKGQVLEALSVIIKHLGFLGLTFTAEGAKRFEKDFDAIISEKVFLARVDELERRYEDETAGLFFLFIPANKVPYFKGEKISPPVSGEFPRAAGEIQEACKCYALSQNTACVFHLMRALEKALKVIAKSLNIPDPTKDADRNWGKMLKTIKTEIDSGNSTLAAEWGTKKHFYEALYAQLEAIKNPWRNATMHVEMNYDEEMALDIFNVTDALFRQMVIGQLSESIL
jgi:alpha-amylase/alpha-mannosidase (GH57 family)